MLLRVDFGFCPDLTSPTAPTLALGYAALDGDRFLGFTWVEDSGWDRHVVDIAMLRAFIESTPETIKQMVEQDWPIDRARRSPGSWLAPAYPSNAGEYLAHCMRNSSVFVTAINPL